MKLLLDTLPVIVFVCVYWLFDLYYATGAMIIVASLHLLIAFVAGNKIDRMQGIGLGILILFGGLTLLLRDYRFIMWKPTVVNWLFALGFLVVSITGKKPLIKRMMEAQIDLPERVWWILNSSWVLFFLLVGTLNLYVAFYYRLSSEDLNTQQIQLVASFQNDREVYSTTVLKKNLVDLETSELDQVKSLSLVEMQDHYLEKLHRDTWVNFKLFGLTGITILFMFFQFLYIWIQMRDLELNMDSRVS